MGSMARGNVTPITAASSAGDLPPELIRRLKGTSLASRLQLRALAEMPPAVRDMFVRGALAGEDISATAYVRARDHRRQRQAAQPVHPLFEAARLATAEELYNFKCLLRDLDNKVARDLWARAERNSMCAV